MSTYRIEQQVDSDGVLHIALPSEARNRKATVIIEIEKDSSAASKDSVEREEFRAAMRELTERQRADGCGDVDRNGWPVGFFERTAGCLADEPIEVPSSLPPGALPEVDAIR